MVVNKEGKVEPRTVQASRTIGDKWLVDGGLVAGDKVIIEGLQKIAPGAPVTPTEAAEADAGKAAALASASAPAMQTASGKPAVAANARQ